MFSNRYPDQKEIFSRLGRRSYNITCEELTTHLRHRYLVSLMSDKLYSLVVTRDKLKEALIKYFGADR
jgi:hypothetical protein